MIAIEIIKALFEGWLNLEQGGVFTLYPEGDEQYIRMFFGIDRVIRGKFEVGDYVYFYTPTADMLEHYNEPADIVIQDHRGAIINLWRVE